MLEFLCGHFIGEMIAIMLLNTNNMIPVITESALPKTDLTIENLKVSPIDDHLTFGIQV